jgi:hypothetical protein
MDLAHLKNIRILLIFTTIFLINCNHKSNQWNEIDQSNEIDQWNEIKINPQISNDSIYRQLDEQAEIFSMLEEQDSLMKRTSDVEYFGREKLYKNLSKFNNCRAFFFKSDTLSINIGISSGHAGDGFIIKYKGKKFYTEPYSWTDAIMIGEDGPKYEIVYQKLTLDKISYKVDDSLFGKIEFKSIETDEYFGKTEHFGKGSFRTKVKKLGM